MYRQIISWIAFICVMCIILVLAIILKITFALYGRQTLLQVKVLVLKNASSRRLLAPIPFQLQVIQLIW